MANATGDLEDSRNDGPAEDPRSGDSGAFPIDRARIHQTMLPPAGEAGLEGPELAELEPSVLSLIPEPPTVSPAELRALRASERAELAVEDLSLRFDNPLNANSLLPPTGASAPKSRWLIALIALAVLGVAGFALFRISAPSQPLAAPRETAARTPSKEATEAPAARSAAEQKAAVIASVEPTRAPTLANATSAQAAQTAVTDGEPGAPRAGEPASAASVVQPASKAPTANEAPAAVSQAAAATAAPTAREASTLSANRPTVAASEGPSAEVPSQTETPAAVAPAADTSTPAVDAAPVAAPAVSATGAAPVNDTARAGEAAPTAPVEQADVASPSHPELAAAPLPESPSREDIANGIEATRGAVTACAAGQHGVANLQVSIASTGRVSHVLVEGAFAGTPAGSCMARALRDARFPAFARPVVKVVYPMSL